MPWGRIDDAFDDDPRVLRLLAQEDGDRALALWTLCFTWANRNTRKPGKTPGLLPFQLPLLKMGPQAYQLVALLERELWQRVDRATPEAGWMIADFAASLPNEDVRRKRSEAGKAGARKRWGNPSQEAPAEPPAAPPAPSRAPTAPTPAPTPAPPGGSAFAQVGELPAFDTPGMTSPNGTLLQLDSKCHNLPMATSVLPSVCHAGATPTDSKVPSNDGNLLRGDGTLLQLAPPADMCEAAEYGTLLSIDGRLPGIDGTLLPPDSKIAPLSLSLSLKEKDSLPPGGGGVIPLLGFAEPTPTDTAAPSGLDGVEDTATGATDGSTARAEYTERFEVFWKAYGARGTKRAAAAQWHKAIKRADPAVILAAVPAYVASTPEVRYRKHAERWLRDDGWLSVIAPPTRAAVGGTPFRNTTEAAYYETGL